MRQLTPFIVLFLLVSACSPPGFIDQSELDSDEVKGEALRWMKIFYRAELKQFTSDPEIIQLEVDRAAQAFRVASSVRHQGEWYLCMVMDVNGEHQVLGIMKTVDGTMAFQDEEVGMQDIREALGDPSFCSRS